MIVVEIESDMNLSVPPNVSWCRMRKIKQESVCAWERERERERERHRERGAGENQIRKKTCN